MMCYNCRCRHLVIRTGFPRFLKPLQLLWCIGVTYAFDVLGHRYA